MSITDELREYALGWDERNRVRRDLTAIADRIDAEHESKVSYWQDASYKDGYDEGAADILAFCDRLKEAAQEREDVTLWGVDYIALPLDADGEPIHVGDVMEFSEFETEHPVTRTVEGIGQGTFFAWCGERGYQQHEPKRYRHHRPPTVEGILRDFGVDIAHALDADPDATVPEAIIAEYAKRLRLAGDAE